MTHTRRRFLQLATVGALLPSIARGARANVADERGSRTREIAAVAFDAFPIFDPRPVYGAVGRYFPGRGAELAAAWRAKQFEYQWLRALTGRYADFWVATEDALDFTLESRQLVLPPGARRALMDGWLQLRTWPDVPGALERLRRSGLRLAFLSNATPQILASGLSASGLAGHFEHVISTDRIHGYKPSPDAYRLGTEVLGLPVQRILFVAFAGWDAAGAKAFGYPTFWVNRLGQPPERLGVAADGAGAGLGDLVQFLEA